MSQFTIACSEPARLGRSLRIWRTLRRMKQAHAAELLGVSQTTISRWENGQQAPTPEEQSDIRRLMQARLDSAADRELARLVRMAGTDVHLICDLTHRLLALSPGRERCWTVSAAELVGTSLWRFASPEIVRAERHLPDAGWYEAAPPAVELDTGANDSDMVRIRPSRLRWVRFQLSDGSFARLVETVAWKEAA